LLGSTRLKRTVLPVCAPLALRITVTYVRGGASSGGEQRAGICPHDDTTHADSDKVIEPCDLVVRRLAARGSVPRGGLHGTFDAFWTVSSARNRVISPSVG